MRCVVTGGAGFIGDHLCLELAARGHDVVALGPVARQSYARTSTARFVEGDVRDEAGLTPVFEGADEVFHLSGLLGTTELFDTPHAAIDVNIKGALNVVLAAKRVGVRRLFLATKPNHWNNLYSVTSQAIEKIGAAYRDSFGMDIRTLRLWNIYGPRQPIGPVRKAVPAFIRDAIAHRPLQVYGDGSHTVELTHVRDAASAITDFLGVRVQPVTYDLGASTRMSVLELARTIIRLSGSGSTIEFLPMREGEGPDQEVVRGPDVRSVLGKRTEIPFDDGMRETIDWYRREN